MKVDPQVFSRKWVVKNAKLKPFQSAEWHDMCADRVHAGVRMWVGKIPPMKWINRVAPVEASQKSGEPRESAKRKTTTMKKLMVIAAVASLATVAEAGIFVNTNCHPRSATCPVVAFKVTANGKIAAPVEKKDDVYKATSKLQIKKGALVLFPVSTGNGDDCCYETYSLYLQVKVNKETYPVGVFFENIDSWSIYGKNYNKSLEAEKSKKFKIESELGLSYAANNSGFGSGIASGGGSGDTVTDSAGLGLIGPLDDFAFIATAFGKGTYAYTYKEKNSACAPCTVTENYEFTPSNYSGWFAGLVSDFGGDYGCLLCNCNDLDVFGGTWKAKYDKSWSKTASGWEKAASYVFGAGTLADMKEAEIE